MFKKRKDRQIVNELKLEIEAELKEEKSRQRKGRLRRFSRHLIKPGIVLGILFLLVLALNYFFHLEVLSITGSTHYTEEEFRKKLVTNPLEENTLYLYLEYRFFKNPDIPFVQKLDLEMLDGHELLVTVYEKNMTACVRYMSEYLYFDKDGIVVESSPELLDDIPVIEGVNFKKMTLYQKMEVADDSIFGTILDITQLLTQYQIPTRRIVFNSRGEVTLYSGKIKIPLGARDAYDAQIATLSRILPKAKQNQLSGVLDLEDYTEGQNRVVFTKEK